MKSGSAADRRARRLVREAGWTITHERPNGDKRWVATKEVTDEEHTVTRMFESSLTLEGLAKAVTRREAEAASYGIRTVAA